MPLCIPIIFKAYQCILPVNIPRDVDDYLYNLLSYAVTNAMFSPKFQAGQWDGRVHLYNKNKNSRTFKAGMLYRVLQGIKDCGYVPELIGFPEATEFQQRSDRYKLRPYQLVAVQKILQYRFGILKAPMRSGKTVIFAAVIDSERQFPAVLFCRSIDLVRQTITILEELLPEVTVGQVADGVVDIQEVTVITIQSAFSALGKIYKSSGDMIKERQLQADRKGVVKNLIASAVAVFYDEVHHGGAKTSRVILDMCIAARLKIGLSATPFTEDGTEEWMLVENSIGPIIHQIGFKELIDGNYILRPTIYMYKLPRFVEVNTDATYRRIYSQGVVENKALARVVKRIVEVLNKKGHSVVIQTEYIAHTKQLADFLGCSFLVGADTTEKRVKVKQELQNKKILCLVSTLFEEGIDVPSLNYTVNLCGGKSDVMTFQRMRSLTATSGKAVAGVIDFIHPYKYLRRHSNRRLNIYRREPEFKLVLRDARGICDV